MPSPASRVHAEMLDRRDHGFADSPVATCRHPLRGFGVATSDGCHGFADSPVAMPSPASRVWGRDLGRLPRVRGLTRGFMPSPASRVHAEMLDRRDHGFADSPVATCRHPLRGFGVATSDGYHGFADSPVAMPSPASRVWGRDLGRLPRVRGLTRGFMPSPASRVGVATPGCRRVGGLHHGLADCTTGSRTHPWLYAVTRFRGFKPRHAVRTTGE